ncbi:hypothetical protein E2C01_002522 [Portunus trituberculatus]|uniref:Uncharacterized protein n=1 Tax=Portunus trituberculatus TaxID=210409 RepID=A0A5B7CMH2_PORTR|nr:hypothetical protein [Portunus trituberculatus]
MDLQLQFSIEFLARISRVLKPTCVPTGMKAGSSTVWCGSVIRLVRALLLPHSARILKLSAGLEFPTVVKDAILFYGSGKIAETGCSDILDTGPLPYPRLRGRVCPVLAHGGDVQGIIEYVVSECATDV